MKGLIWGLRTKIGLEGRLGFRWVWGKIFKSEGIENEFQTIFSVPDTQYLTTCIC